MAAPNIRLAGFPGIAPPQLQPGDLPAGAPVLLAWVFAWVSRYASSNFRP